MKQSEITNKFRDICEKQNISVEMLIRCGAFDYKCIERFMIVYTCKEFQKTMGKMESYIATAELLNVSDATVRLYMSKKIVVYT